jgi:hypothetical protein
MMVKKKMTAPKAPKAPATRVPKPTQAQAEAKPPKLSAVDAAAKVLAETGQPMTCPELIAAMAAKGYWTSPAGRTPAATLYTAVTMLPKT